MKSKILRIMMMAIVAGVLVAAGGFIECKAGDENSDKPRLVGQTGHAWQVASVAFSLDGRYALSGSWDNTLKLWDTATGKELRTFTGHLGQIQAVALSQDGKYAVSGSEDKTMKLWDIATGKELRTFMGHLWGIETVAFSPDGRYVLSGSADHTMKLWDIATGKELRTFTGHSNKVKSLAFSPDGRHIISGSSGLMKLKSASLSLEPSDVTMKLWDVATGKEIRTFTGQSSLVWSIAFSPDGRHAISGSSDGTLKLWDVTTGKEIRTFTGHAELVASVSFSPDGRHALSGSSDGTLKLWDVTTGKEIRTFTGNAYSVNSIAFSPDGRYAISGRGDNTMNLWDIATGKELRTFTGHSDTAFSAVFSPDGRYFLSGNFYHTMKLWDVTTGKEIRTFKGHSDVVHSVAFSLDGKYALSGSRDKTMKLWNIATGKEIRTFTGHTSWINSVSFSPNGHSVLSGGGFMFERDDYTLKQWDVATGKEIRTFMGHAELVHSVSFSPDGRHALSGSSDKTLKLWDVGTGRELLTLAGHGSYVSSVAFSPDGKTVVSGSWDNTLKLWDVATGKELRTFTGHLGNVNSVAYNPNGRYALSVASDKTMMLWNITTGQWLAKLYSFTDGTWAVVDPDGRFDASNGGDVNGLHWVVGNTPIDLKQLKERYYEPGLLAKIMGYNKEPLRNVKAFDSVAMYPDVEVIPPSGEGTKAKIKLKNQGGGIGKVRVLVNGKEIVADARGPKPDAKAKKAEYEIEISPDSIVPGGENKIEVIASNAENYLDSRGTPVHWKDTRKASNDPPELYAIVCGASKYGNPGINLNFSGKDAMDMAAALKVSAKRLFGTDKVHLSLLTDYEGAKDALLPTRENIEKAFAAARKAKSTDILVVYLAGHGVMAGSTDNGDYYYLTREARSTDLSDPEIRKQYGISSMELTEWIKKIPALKQVMVLDTCAAGGAVTKLIEKRNVPSEQTRSLERLKDRTGFHVLMGAASDKVSLEASQYGQGLLTYSLLEGMRGAALKDDQFVDVQKLFAHAAERVPNLAKSIGGIQTPLISSPRGQSFDIGQVTKEDKSQIPLAMVKPMVLRSVFQLASRPVDTLGLSKLVNSELRESSVVSRGISQLVYVDAEELPGAYLLSGRYSKEGDNVKVEAYLYEGEKEKGNFTVTGKEADLAALAKSIVDKAIDKVGK